MKLALAIVIICSLLAYSSGEAEKYTLDTYDGIVARLDLINSLKIALHISRPKPTKIERDAAVVFAEFLSTSAMNEYLSTFYTNSVLTPDKPNPFLSFLNGFLYSGNPDLPVWHAAEILVRMIKTKVNNEKVEVLRRKAMKPATIKARAAAKVDVEKFNYMQRFRERGIIQLGPLIARLQQEYRDA